MGEIEKYEHPYVTVDGVVLRFFDRQLEVLLIQREKPPEQGKWGLPGGFVDVDKLLDKSLQLKVSGKTAVSGFYMEQLKTYDALDRDPRGRVLSVAYLALTNRQVAAGEWFALKKRSLVRGETKLSYRDLAFDHGQIIQDALERLAGKLWYSDLPKYLLPDEFTISDASRLCELLEGRETTMLLRKLGDRVTKTGAVRPANKETGGRPAALFRWVKRK